MGVRTSIWFYSAAIDTEKPFLNKVFEIVRPIGAYPAVRRSSAYAEALARGEQFDDEDEDDEVLRPDTSVDGFMATLRPGSHLGVALKAPAFVEEMLTELIGLCPDQEGFPTPPCEPSIMVGLHPIEGTSLVAYPYQDIAVVARVSLVLRGQGSPVDGHEFAAKAIVLPGILRIARELRTVAADLRVEVVGS